jgi:23S rRNA (cytosine1962-C5)-methyltransferase
MTGRVILKSGREKSVLNRHPWVFSGAVARLEGDPDDIVDVCDSGGRFLARGTYNARSQIRVRLLTWDGSEQIDANFWRARLTAAIERRAALAGDPSFTAYRLAHAESDGLAGLIVDRYGDWLVIQALTLGIERHKREIIEALVDLTEPVGVLERSDVDVRRLEGLPEAKGVLWGQAPPERVEIVEGGLRYLVDLYDGHKTGFYLDQRENRAWLARQPLAGCEVLDAFCYTGGFAVCAAEAGATRLVCVDGSRPALDLARDNLTLNGYADLPVEFVEADVFQQLRIWRDGGRTFDVVILDPPKFVHSRGQMQRGLRGYKDINLLAFQILRPGGLLLAFSCSGLVSDDLFQKVVFGASLDAGRQAQIVARLHQGADHPVLLSFPEGSYLKGLACRVW